MYGFSVFHWKAFLYIVHNANTTVNQYKETSSET